MRRAVRIRGHFPNDRAVLDRSRGPRDVDLPGLRLHPLKGELQGHYAVAVSANWRVTFRFEDGDAVEVDYLDYQ